MFSRQIKFDPVVGIMLGTQDLASKSTFQFSRIQEKQADKFALDVMKRKRYLLMV